MKEMLKNALLAYLTDKMDATQLKAVAEAYDQAAVGFDISKSSTALIVADDRLMMAAKEYIAVRKTQGDSDGTLQGYWLILKNFAETIGKPLNDISISDVRLWFYSYQQRRGISDRTKNHLEGIIKGFFSWMCDEGYTEKDILRPYKRTKYVPRQKEALSQMNLEKLLDSAKENIRDHCLLMLLYATACRCSEVANIKISDINMEKGQILVLGKGRKYRTVYFDGRAVIALKKWLKQRPNTNGEYLFPGRKTGHLGTKQILNIVKKYAGKSECPAGTTTHTMRHTTATIALERGCPVQDVQRMLGHSNIATTMIYAQVSDTSVRASHERCVV